MIEHSLFFIALLFLSYVIGSIPTSIIMGKLVKGIDIREHGSGNAGGTNVFRVLGWKPALVVLIVDVGKGWLPPAVLAVYFIDYMPISDSGFIQIACGFASILGRWKRRRDFRRDAHSTLSHCNSLVSDGIYYYIDDDRLCFGGIHAGFCFPAIVFIYPSCCYVNITSVTFLDDLFTARPMVYCFYASE